MVLFATTIAVAVCVAIGGRTVEVGKLAVSVGTSVPAGGAVVFVEFGTMLVAVTVTFGGRVWVGAASVGGGDVAASCSPTMTVILLESSSPSALDTRTLMI